MFNGEERFSYEPRTKLVVLGKMPSSNVGLPFRFCRLGMWIMGYRFWGSSRQLVYKSVHPQNLSATHMRQGQKSLDG